MTIDVRIVHNGKRVKVTSSGELVTSAIAYDDSVSNTMSATGTAYNFYTPISGKQFVITGVNVFANKDISDASDTIIEIYESGDSASIIIDKALFSFGMGKLTSLPIVPIRVLVNEGAFVNSQTDDATIFMTILGHYIDKL